MSDEEKIKKARGIICHNCRWNECDNNSCPTLLDTIKAIDLGHAEGKPKWHEIESHVKPSREIEKQYMPKAGERVLLKYHFYNDEEIHYSDGYYDNYDFEFHITNNATGKVICAIAWCEIEGL